ncbi:MAG: ATP-dependent Clp protease ATP-binding subunit [Candidatus Aquicultorales bacterium]
MDPSGQEALNRAAEAASSRDFDYVGTEHILLGLTEEPVASKLLESLGVNLAELRKEIDDLIGRGTGVKEELALSPRSKRALQLAQEDARRTGSNFIGSVHLLSGIINEGESISAQMLAERGVTSERLSAEAYRGGEAPAGGELRAPTSIPRRSSTPTLDQFSRDLTGMAREGKLDPVIGRGEQIDRVIRILSRRTKNNPALIGEAGVGKTAVVEGLAQRIICDEVPEILKDKRVVQLDLSGMIAGTKYRGEFEERLKKALDEILARPSEIILFIDELHTLVGAGAAEGAMDASNILKPALARGDLQAIGATTIDEYRKHIEGDPALERRFQPVLVPEPTVDETIEILRGLRDRYEAHHRVKIEDASLVAAAQLADRYISDRYLPDKAIDLIDEAGAKVRLQSTVAPVNVKDIEEKLEQVVREKEEAVRTEDYQKAMQLRERESTLKEELEQVERDWLRARGTTNSVVTPEDIAEIIASWTGIPAQKLVEEEKERLLKTEETLHRRVIGQEEAITAVSEAIRRARAGLKDPKRPIGSFIFLGPTGVGKTELARALAEHLFGNEEAMIRLDMSEYMERHTVSRLIGAPPGYVGHEEAGQLTEPVRRRPYSVVLFDEVEKAHPDVLNILLQIMDDGRITDSKGRSVDFKNTIVIMTSNIGSAALKKAPQLGFKVTEADKKSVSEIKETVIRELQKTLRPEFLNRIDEIIVFEPLTREEIARIVDIMLDRVSRGLRGQGVTLEVTDSAKSVLAEKGYDPDLGARPLRRTIRRLIENPLATALLKGTFTQGDTVWADAKDGEIAFSKVD